MKEKRKDCLCCGKEMFDVKTVRKKFCSDLCRVNFNNEVKYEKEVREILDKPIFNKLKKDVLFNLIVYGEAKVDLSEHNRKQIPTSNSEVSKENETPKAELQLIRKEHKEMPKGLSFHQQLFWQKQNR